MELQIVASTKIRQHGLITVHDQCVQSATHTPPHAPKLFKTKENCISPSSSSAYHWHWLTALPEMNRRCGLICEKWKVASPNERYQQMLRSSRRRRRRRRPSIQHFPRVIR